MATNARLGRFKKIILTVTAIFAFLFFVLMFFVDRLIEPILKDRIHTLIIQGSDSLYTYSLGRLNANFYGGNVSIENLQIKVDSNRYEYLRQQNALPALTMQLTLGRGQIKGVGIFDLLFGKKIRVQEILSKDANLKLSRHVRPYEAPRTNIPLWKAIEPKIKSIYIGRIRLQGIKMNYRNADTSESVKIEFEGCDALFKDIRIDSAAAADTSRIGFTRSIQLQIQEAKYRTPDSSYKLKMDTVSYSSEDRILDIKDFKFQPTLEKDQFYLNKTVQQPMYKIKFGRIKLTNLHLDHFIRNNIIDPDSILFEEPDISIYNDRTLEPDFESKIGKYPHQQLLKASGIINVKNILFRKGQILYTEKNNKTHQEGTIGFQDLDLNADNVTNDKMLIQKNPFCNAALKGKILGSSPFEIKFRFYLDSLNGRYDATGSISDINSAQLNALAIPLANVQVNSFNIHSLGFQVSGEDYSAKANVSMRYNGLSLVMRKTDEETGQVKTKKFLTKILNRFMIWPDNPGPDGRERAATNRQVSRLTTQSFFGFLWKTIFAGMQDIMMRSGRYE